MEEMSQAPRASSQAAPKETRPIYEVGFHIVPTVEETEVGGVVEKIKAELKKSDAEIISEGAPQKMRLAYTLERASQGKREKFDDAYFGFIKFAMEREHIEGLEQLLRSSREILRYLLITTVREDIMAAPRRVTFASDRLEGETIKKPAQEPEKAGEVSEEDLEKSIDALVS